MLPATSAPTTMPQIVLTNGLLVSGHAPVGQPTTLYQPKPNAPPTTAPMMIRKIIKRDTYFMFRQAKAAVAVVACSSHCSKARAGGMPTSVSATCPSRKSISVGTPAML